MLFVTIAATMTDKPTFSTLHFVPLEPFTLLAEFLACSEYNFASTGSAGGASGIQYDASVCFTSVDVPEPFGPRNPKISPTAIVKLTLLIARCKQ